MLSDSVPSIRSVVNYLLTTRPLSDSVPSVPSVVNDLLTTLPLSDSVPSVVNYLLTNATRSSAVMTYMKLGDGEPSFLNPSPPSPLW